MEFKKYNPFVVMNKHKSEAKPKSKPKLEAMGLWRSIGETGSRMDRVLSQENKKKLDIIYAGGFVKTSRK